MNASPSADNEIPNGSGVDEQHPWPGPSPYTEASRDFFHGRGQYVDDLFRHVRRNLLTVLFGLSGLGKTSLLKAGLFPELRRHGFVPVSIRLDYTTEAPEPANQIKAAIVAADLDKECSPGSAETLWEYFHRVDVCPQGPDGTPVSVVLVFDQFEELFTIGQTTAARAARAAMFVDELAALVEDRPAAHVEQRLEENPDEVAKFAFDRQSFRVLLCLRADYLAQLEGLRDRMPSLRANYMPELKQMNGVQALEAVMDPAAAADLIAPDIARQIVRFVAGSTRKEMDRAASPVTQAALEDVKVEPFLLSLVCSELNKRRLSQGLAQISADLLAGSSERILQDFYDRCLAHHPPAVRAFVEDELLTDAGFRIDMPLERAGRFLAEHGAAPDAIEDLVTQRLLHKEDRLNVKRVELTHDVLTKVVQKSRDARQQQERVEAEHQRVQALKDELRETNAVRRRWRSRFLMAVGCLLVAFASLVVALLMWHRAETSDNSARKLAKATEKAEEEKAKADTALLNEAQVREDLSKKTYVYSLNLAEHRWGQNEVLWARRLLKETPNDYRRWEWNHLALVTEPELRSFKAHSGEVRQVAFSPDGRRLGSASADGSVKVWDLFGDPKPLFDLHHDQSVRLIAFGPDGGIVSITDDNTVKTWNARGQLRRAFTDLGRGEWALSRDCRQLAVANAQAKQLKIWDIKSGEHANLKDSDGNVKQLAFSPDGKHLASVETPLEKTAIVRLWAINTAKEPQALTSFGEVTEVAFSDDSRRLASATSDGTVRVWEVANGKSLFDLRVPQGFVRRIVFSPAGNRLASATFDQVQVWDLDNGRQLATLSGHTDKITKIYFHPDGALLLSASDDRTVKIWDVDKGKELITLRGHTDRVNDAVFSPDGKRLASASDDTLVKTWTVSGAKQTLKLSGHTKLISHMAFSHDGRRLASASQDKTVRVWQPGTGKEFVTFKGHQAQVRYVVFDSKDASRLASVDAGGALKVWDAATGKETLTFKEVLGGPAFVATTVGLFAAPMGQLPEISAIIGNIKDLGPQNHMAFDPDGTRLALAGKDGTVKIWNIRNDKKLHSLLGHGRPVYHVAFSSDGKILASNDDQRVLVWNADEGTRIRALEGQPSKVSMIAFSPKGRRLAAAGDQGVCLWDLNNGWKPQNLEHKGPVNYVVFSPDDQLLASAGADKTIKVWDIASGKLIHTLEGHSRLIIGVAFGPRDPPREVADRIEAADRWRNAIAARDNLGLTGRRLASVGEDQTVKIWDLATGDQLLSLKGGTSQVLFSPDGKQLVSAGSDNAVTVWQSLFTAKVLTERERIWQEHQAQSAATDGREHAALFHLTQLIKDRSSAALLAQRGSAFAKQKQWQKAALDFEAAGQQEPGKSKHYYHQGMVLLAMEDLRGFRKISSEMLQRFAEKADASTADDVVWLATLDPSGVERIPSMAAGILGFACPSCGQGPFLATFALVPGPVNFQALVRLEEDKALKQDPNRWIYLESLGAALYRAGDFAAARRRLEEAIAKKGGEGTWWMQFFMAMADHKLKNRAEARSWLIKAASQMVEQEPMDWTDEIRSTRVLHEAETLLGTKAFVLRKNDRLLATDSKDLRNQSFRKSYEVPMVAGASYRIEMVRAKDTIMEPLLRLEDSAGKQLDSDDSSGKPNAQIVFTCSHADTFKIIATTYFRQTGAFNLTVQQITPSAIPLDNGIARVPDKLTDRKPSKLYSLELARGKTYVIDMIPGKANSTVKPSLFLGDSTGKQIAQNYSLGLPSARILFLCDRTDTYRILARSQLRQTGDFSLFIQERNALPDLQIVLKDGKGRVDGELTSADLKDRKYTDSFCKVYTVKMAANKLYEIEMIGDNLNAYLRMEDDKGPLNALPRVPDSAAGRSFIAFRNARAATYRLIATTVTPGTGNFSLKVQENDLPELKITLQNGAATLEDELTGSDLKDAVRSNSYCKTYAVTLKTGKTYQIDMKSIGNLDPYLRLEDNNGNTLKEDDDSGGGLNARIVFRCLSGGVYRIFATTFPREETGRYSLTVKEN